MKSIWHSGMLKFFKVLGFGFRPAISTCRCDHGQGFRIPGFALLCVGMPTMI